MTRCSGYEGCCRSVTPGSSSRSVPVSPTGNWNNQAASGTSKLAVPTGMCQSESEPRWYSKAPGRDNVNAGRNLNPPSIQAQLQVEVQVDSELMQPASASTPSPSRRTVTQPPSIPVTPSRRSRPPSRMARIADNALAAFVKVIVDVHNATTSGVLARYGQNERMKKRFSRRGYRIQIGFGLHKGTLRVIFSCVPLAVSR